MGRTKGFSKVSSMIHFSSGPRYQRLILGQGTGMERRGPTGDRVARRREQKYVADAGGP